MAWETVYEMVRRIPKGRVIAYGQLARAVKLRGGARAAGYALAACPAGRAIPWHRVIGAGGRILLREPRGALQRRLLESEGVQFRGARIDIAGREWHPPMPRKRPRPAARQAKRRPRPS